MNPYALFFSACLWVIIILGIVAVAGCDEQEGSDALSTKIEKDLTITWTIVPSMERMQELLDANGGGDNGRATGFATYYLGRDGKPMTCRIYTLLPKATDDFANIATIRHEIKHCVEGAWH